MLILELAARSSQKPGKLRFLEAAPASTLCLVNFGTSYICMVKFCRDLIITLIGRTGGLHHF